MTIHRVHPNKPFLTIIEKGLVSPIWTVKGIHNLSLHFENEQDRPRVILERACPGQSIGNVKEPASAELWYPCTVKDVMNEPEQHVVYRLRAPERVGRIAIRVGQNNG